MGVFACVWSRRRNEEKRDGEACAGGGVDGVDSWMDGEMGISVCIVLLKAKAAQHTNGARHDGARLKLLTPCGRTRP